MTVGKKVVKALRALRLTQESGAEIMGISRGSIASYSSRDNANPSIDKVQRLVQYSIEKGKPIPEEWFYDGENTPVPVGSSTLTESPDYGSTSPAPGFDPPGPYADRQSYPKVGRRLFPLLGHIGAAEFPVDPGDAEDFVEFSDDLYSESPQRYAVRVSGDSMEPTWKANDFALVHPDRSFRTTSMYVAVQFECQPLIKILLRGTNGQMYLVPENPQYEPIPIDQEGWEMIGPVVGFRREFGSRRYKEWGENYGLIPDDDVLRTAKSRLKDWLDN